MSGGRPPGETARGQLGRRAAAPGARGVKPMAVSGARQVAWEVLTSVLGPGRAAADEALDRHPAMAMLAARDRAFANTLVLTTLRHLGELDAALAPHLRRIPDDPRVLSLLRLGAAQLLQLRTPPHAAVNETLRLAQGRLTGLVPMLNAVLRQVSAADPAVLEGEDRLRLSTPGWLWEAWLAAYGQAATRAIATAHQAEAPIDLRTKGPPEPWVQPLAAEHLPDGTLRRLPGGRIEDLPGFAEGAWWVQDVAAGLPARLLGEVAGRRVLDLCAAPGGKTMQLAAAGAIVTAVDLTASRAALLRANLARTGLGADVVVADVLDWRPEHALDLVLLDAPCTATGTIRRHPDIAYAKTQEDVMRLAAAQARLLAAAVDMTAVGGRLVYAVCSLQPEEGPMVVARTLAQQAGLALEPIAAAELGGLPLAPASDGTLRTLPSDLADQGGMDGFYVARLRRRG